ncbi:MAG: thioredoxin [Bacteroidales bacterium]|nr:thioredoxin [Bacteroidales bacterium]
MNIKTSFILLLILSFIACKQSGEKSSNDVIAPNPKKEVKEKVHKIEYLNSNSFKEKVFDYTGNKEWDFKGNAPCIIDFYADWCAPCRSIAPILEELSKEYKGKINIYKVNVDTEKELAMAFNVQSIPMLLFCPVDDKPSVLRGAVPKDVIVEQINSKLLNSINTKL